jgi:hypothetical protein
MSPDVAMVVDDLVFDSLSAEGRNKLGRLVVELAILVSLPRWAPMGGEEDHPEAESLCSPLRRHLFCEAFHCTCSGEFRSSHRNESR